LRELIGWLNNGNELLANETEDKGEKITDFINNFSGYLEVNKEADDYVTKIISLNIQESEKSNFSRSY